MGDLRLEEGDLEGAREHYDAALVLDPDFGYALLQRGLVAEREGDAQEAVRHYMRATLGVDPADRVALAARARLRALLGGP